MSKEIGGLFPGDTELFVKEMESFIQSVDLFINESKIDCCEKNMPITQGKVIDLEKFKVEKGKKMIAKAFFEGQYIVDDET